MAEIFIRGDIFESNTTLRADVNFKDCDLIGCPIRVTVSPKTLQSGNVEVKVRRSGEFMTFARADVVKNILELLNDL